MHDDLFKIFQAEPADIPAILKLETEGFRPPWTHASFEQEFKNSQSSIFKTVFESRICGFLVLRKLIDEIEILKICTEKKMQNKNIASSLLNYVLNNPGNNIKYALLEVNSENIKALNFYKKNGFKISGIRNNYYGQGINALNMTKELPGGEK
ncbi:MAG: ribosomal protein S18-alanine N-acetyltransferase [Thermodesulfobacteriota bacterium]